MAKNTVVEVSFGLGNTVRVEVSPAGNVEVSGVRYVNVTHQVQPSPEKSGDAKEVTTFVAPIIGYGMWQVDYIQGVEVTFQPISGSHWASLGLARPSFAAILSPSDESVEVSSIDCYGKEKHILGVMPSRTHVVASKSKDEGVVEM